jgi:hypothetical protein
MARAVVSLCVANLQMTGRCVFRFGAVRPLTTNWSANRGLRAIVTLDRASGHILGVRLGGLRLV